MVSDQNHRAAMVDTENSLGAVYIRTGWILHPKDSPTDETSVHRTLVYTSVRTGAVLSNTVQYLHCLLWRLGDSFAFLLRKN